MRGVSGVLCQRGLCPTCPSPSTVLRGSVSLVGHQGTLSSLSHQGTAGTVGGQDYSQVESYIHELMNYS